MKVIVMVLDNLGNCNRREFNEVKGTHVDENKFLVIRCENKTYYIHISYIVEYSVSN